MSAGIGAVAAAPGGLAARISAIQSRFGPPSPLPSESGPIPVLGAAAAFDPFGEAYQEALEAAELAATSTPAATLAPAIPQRLLAQALPSPASFGGAPAPAAGGPTTAQIGAAIAGVAGPPGVRPTGGYGPMPVPAELVPFGNGRVPAAALQPLASQPNHRLAAPAAAAWDAVVAAAAAEGIELRITDSYRSYDEQVDLAARKGLYSQGGLAATPGTSNHGWGLAVDADVTDPATLAWLRTNGPRFGWLETVGREPWHWEFRPHQV